MALRRGSGRKSYLSVPHNFVMYRKVLTPVESSFSIPSAAFLTIRLLFFRQIGLFVSILLSSFILFVVVR